MSGCVLVDCTGTEPVMDLRVVQGDNKGWVSRIPDPYLAQLWPNRPADIDKDAIVDAYEYGVHFHFRFEVRLDANCQSPGR